MGSIEEIGHTLQETRQRLGYTLEHVEQETRIRAARLEALERGDVESLPSQVQARGFLHNYAAFLGLDAEQIVARFDEAMLPARRSPFRRRPSAPDRPSEGGLRVGRPRRFSFDLVLTALVSLGVLAVLVWGGIRLFAGLGAGAASPEQAPPSPTATQTSAAAEIAAVSSPPGPAIQPTNGITPTATLVLGLRETVALRIEAEREAWLRVLVDGEQIFQGRLQPGDAQEYQGVDSVEVLTGNGAGLHIFVNGQDQGLMGDVGQVVIRIYTPNGVLTPTPTVTPSPTGTLEATVTPTLTRTPPPNQVP